MRSRNPFLDYWGNAMQVGFVMAEAQAVIAMRLMGLAGFWSVTPSENRRMVSEKVQAMVKGSMDAGVAELQGQPPDKVAAAAIKPVRRATRANCRRLAKRGPKRV